jgi:hypothetical protein
MRFKQLVARAMVAGGLALAAVGLGVEVANHPPSPPQVPNVPAAALPALPTAIAGTNDATAMANGNQSVPTTTATPFGGERTPSSGAIGLTPPGVGVTAIPLRGPLGGLLG